ncbi:unnamed protein product [Linum trigynum]|uniref:Cysteine-rich receptor-like protein kinase 29 n=2 Tax=Linum trigynum TaxID=586398 RepID=A0AAV2FJ37_9ROSI
MNRKTPNSMASSSSQPMSSPSSIHPPLPHLLVVLLLLLFLPSCTIAQPPPFALSNCADQVGNYTAGSAYGRNLNALLSTLAADNQTTTGFYNRSSGRGADRVNAIGLCRGDVGPPDCRGCIANATGRILMDCPAQKEAFGYYEFCMIRYSNWPIQGTLDLGPPVTFFMWNVNNASGPAQFDAALGSLLARLRAEAAGGSSVRKFATGTARQGFVTIFALVQCSPDLSEQQCDDCLVGAIGRIPDCCDGKIGGRVIQRTCNLRFETSRFYSKTAAPPTEGGRGSENSSRIVAIVVPIVGTAVLGFIFIFFFCSRRKRKRSTIPNQRSSQQEDATVDEIINNEGWLQYDFETIQAATNDFADESKLGEGGFGAVYKGVLSNGEQVAVKRLGIDSRQGDLEFKNEVKLVARLQHRNLARLLGFCLEGREKLLIYEFIPNASLDHFLFDEFKRVHLNWERRYNIIGGIARGMVYLHEDSRLRIIHRDLKASNILLDAEMNAKISDFGMARLFDIDETQGNTSRIVGTYGYMAPEYVMHGQFSVKSDVFSFGVLILEIVSGQRNNCARGGSSMEDLLSYAWKNWRNGTYTSLIDPSLGNNVSGSEVARCIHIGLLCVQEYVNDRPTMATVALMLTSQSMTLPLPSKPAFFMHSGTGDGVSSSWGYSSTSREGTGSSPSAEALSLSRNDVSITELYPR